jgi:hypothetical protein
LIVPFLEGVIFDLSFRKDMATLLDAMLSMAFRPLYLNILVITAV